MEPIACVVNLLMFGAVYYKLNRLKVISLSLTYKTKARSNYSKLLQDTKVSSVKLNR